MIKQTNHKYIHYELRKKDATQELKEHSKLSVYATTNSRVAMAAAAAE